MTVSRMISSVVVLVAFLVGPAFALNIETVPVGNPGNAGDSRNAGFGAVDYTYNIGKYEVTAGQYTEFLSKVAATDTYGLYNTGMANTQFGSGISRSGSSGSYTYSVDAAFVNRPVNFVSWGDAARFANWLHNGQPTGMQGAGTTETGAYALNGARTNAELLAVTRSANWNWAITSEDEWYKAAYHKNNGVTGDYWEYPTSSDSFPGRDLDDLSGNNANYLGDPTPIQPPYYTTMGGEFQNSDSPYGTFDQGGNVSEWNEAVIGSFRGLRGGAFNSDSLRASTRSFTDLSFEVPDFGFRVSEVPEPTSMALLAFGVASVLVRRRGLGR